MDVEELIFQIRSNPAIWDKNLKAHSNRKTVDDCWRKISLEMNLSEAVLRKKWKYLRDQFCVECNKVTTPGSGDSQDILAEPKWPHFKHLLFLKGIIRPRAISSSSSQPTIQEENDCSVDQDKMENIDQAQAEKEYAEENVTEAIPFRKRRRDFYQADAEKTYPEENVTEAIPFRKIRRERVTRRSYKERILEVEREKLELLLRAVNCEPENYDLLFFQSLLPFVSKIPFEKKLAFRSRILEVTQEFTSSTLDKK